MPAIASDSAVGHRLLEQLANARQQTDDLFAIIKSDSLYERPIAERHRIIFYVGHLEAFDWNLLYVRTLGLKRFDPEFDRLFAFGIDPVGGGLPTDQPPDWPSIARVKEYVEKVRGVLNDRLADALADSHLSTSDGFSLPTLMHVAVEHRLMHAETLAYMLHQLPLSHKILQNESFITTAPQAPHLVEIPEGRVTLGIPRGGDIFGWDNEFEAHTVEVPTFSIDQHMVTNGQFLEFVQAGGYKSRDLWTGGENGGQDRKGEDWKWKSEQGISHPAFWKRDGDRWVYRTMFEELPLPLDWPVYVSQAEAKAYARWAGKSLPTEAEWQRAAYGTPDRSNRSYPWGEQAPDPSLGNFDFARWSPAPVNAFPRGQSAFGLHGMLGNGWEWTATEFAPFPGFEAFAFYRGYSADFFDGKHFVMKGGSGRTAASMLRRSFRNWFQAHYQYAYAGFRCVSH